MVKVLKDLNIDEVSLVDKAANKRRFFVIKNEEGNTMFAVDRIEKTKKTKIKIDSDGSLEGTTVKVNGKEISPLELYFSFYKYGDDETETPISFRYLTSEKDSNGNFTTMTSHTLLQKNDETIPALSKTDVATIKNFTEADLETIDEVKAHLLAKQLDILADYREIAPMEVREAITSLTGIAVSGTIEQVVEKKEGEIEMKKEDTTEVVDSTEVQQEIENDNTIKFDYEKLASLVAEKLGAQTKEEVETVEETVALTTEAATEEVVKTPVESIVVEDKQSVEETEKEIDMNVKELAGLIIDAATGS